MSYEDSGQYQVLRERRGPNKEKIQDWLTWATRAVIVAICGMAYRQAQLIESTLQDTQATLQSTQITIAKMSVQQDTQSKQLDAHSQQIERIWQEIRRQ